MDPTADIPPYNMVATWTICTMGTFIIPMGTTWTNMPLTSQSKTRPIVRLTINVEATLMTMYTALVVGTRPFLMVIMWIIWWMVICTIPMMDTAMTMGL